MSPSLNTDLTNIYPGPGYSTLKMPTSRYHEDPYRPMNIPCHGLCNMPAGVYPAEEDGEIGMVLSERHREINEV